MIDYWSVPADDALSAAESSAAGLSSAQARHRREQAGTVRRTREGSVLHLLLANFRSPIALLLLAAGVVSIALGEQVDGGIITVALLTSGLLGAWQEHRASGAVERLLARVRPLVTVLRDGTPTNVPGEEVVPGDVVILVAGSGIVGDARLLDARDLFVDQSMLTGESVPSEKEAGIVAPETPLASRHNVVLAGTHVVSGTGTAVVMATGPGTAYGEIAARLASRPPATEFERGIRQFGYLLIEITMVLVLATFAINVGRDRAVLDTLLFALALAVGLTPQLLPAIVAVTLARGAQRLARERVIVRRLASIEDLGGMEILCTDKTGTITEGTIRVHATEDCAGAPSRRVALLAFLNATFESGFPNPIDEALRRLPVPEADGWTKVDEIPYDFGRKRLSVVVRDPAGRHLLVVKGAVQSILAACTTTERADGTTAPLATTQPAIERRAQALGSEGYRSLGVAWREVPAGVRCSREDERDLTFAGLLSLADPLKPDAAGTLRELNALGIRPKLVTGDSRHVAARVAQEAGLDTTRVVTGGDLDRMGTTALARTAVEVAVFAEMEPRHKERVIRSLKQSSYCVGYLGDGINDATSLHAADVGISVDSASDVTRQAADIVLLGKDLRVLARGVREGRRAFANTLKYVFITTSANFGNMFSMAAASIVSPFLPLLPKQILITNVLTDLPAMTIATDAIDPELGARPRRWNNREIARFLIAFGLISSVFDLLTFGALTFLRVSPAVFRTGWFVESILSELLILLVIRTSRPFFRSRVSGGLAGMSLVVGVVTCVLPFTGAAAPLGLAPLPPVVALTIAAIVTAYTATSDLTKRHVLRWARDDRGLGRDALLASMVRR